MTLENIIIFFAIGLLFLYSMGLLQFITFLYYTFNYLDFKQIEKDDVPVDVWEMMKPSEEFLCSKGFKYITMLEHHSPIVGNRQKYYIAYYYNEKNAVHAFVKTQPHRGALEAITIVYKTLYENGKRVETVNGAAYFIPATPSDVTLHDHYLVDNEAIYLTHLKDREKENSSVLKVSLSKDNIVEYKIQDEKEYVQSWEDAGVVKSNDEGYRFRFTWVTWKFALQSAKGYKSYAKILRNRKDNIKTNGGESYAIIAQLDEMGKERGKSNKLLWFGVSMFFFAGLFGLLGFSFSDIVVLVTVLLVHELGHYLAMRYYGYTDTSIFFLPFGAAAVGRKEHRNAYEEYVVFLAGPLPGIIIGIAIIGWSFVQYHNISGDTTLMMYGMMSLVINYINLLPIYPLDGGRILQLLLLHRYPKGQFYFYMVSFLVLVVAMVWLQDPILLIFVIIVGLGVKQSYRVSQFLAKLFAHYTTTELTKEIVVEKIAEDESYSKDTLHAKANVAKQILHIVQTSKPSRWLVGFGMIFYLLLLTPPFVVGYVMTYDSNPSEYSKLPEDAQHRLDGFYEKQSSYEGLTEAAQENYTLEASMEILEKYLYDKDINRTVGKASVFSKDTNLSDIPKALQKLYTWHNGITQLLPEEDFLSLKELHNNHANTIKEMREYNDSNFSILYRVFIGEYGYGGLAYHLEKQGIYEYYTYNNDKPIKSYYSINHLLKLTAEAYKAGVYYYDYDELSIDEFELAKLKRAYLSQVDKKRYELHIQYLKERAIAFSTSPHVYVKKEILWALGRMHDSRLIPSIGLYLTDKNKKVRQQAVHSLGVLGDRSVIPLLVEQLDDAPVHCKGCALSGLIYLVSTEDGSLLEKIYPLLDDKTMWIRRNAYHAIGEIANKDSFMRLKERFNDEKPSCKLAIAEAFGRIGKKEALPLLKNYLKEIDNMDFSVSYMGRSRSKNPHPQTLKYGVEKAIYVLEK